METRHLFGDAMSIQLPPAFIDVSEIRQVPDSQEVFVDTESDHSVVIELMEMITSDDPIRHHFDELAHENEAGGHSILHVWNKVDSSKADFTRRISQEAQIWTAVGTQLISKFNQHDWDIVNIYLALIRLPQCASMTICIH